MREESSFIGIDYHKGYSVFCVLDRQGAARERGRIDHVCPEQFVLLVRRWPGCRVVFEACMNWHWLLEILEGCRLVGSVCKNGMWCTSGR